MRFPLVLKDPVNNGTDGQQSLVLPARRHADVTMTLRAGTCTPAQLPLIQLWVNNKEQWTMTGEQLDALNQLAGYPAFAGTNTGDVLRIPFGLPRLNDSALATLSELNMDGVEVKSAELRWTTSGATTPTWDMVSNGEPATGEGAGVVKKYYINTEQGYGTSEKISGLEFPCGDESSQWWTKMLIRPSANNVTRVRMLVKGTEIYDSQTPPVANILTAAGWVPGSYFGHSAIFPLDNQGVAPVKDSTGKIIQLHMPFVPMENISQNDVKVAVTCDGPANLTFVHEYLGKPGK